MQCWRFPALYNIGSTILYNFKSIEYQFFWLTLYTNSVYVHPIYWVPRKTIPIGNRQCKLHVIDVVSAEGWQLLCRLHYEMQNTLHIATVCRFITFYYWVQQLNQDISELFSLDDQSLFPSLQKNSHHVLQRLLPAKSAQPYNLRACRHSFPLTQKQSTVISSPACYFTIYWLNYFLALPRMSLFHCAACHTW